MLSTDTVLQRLHQERAKLADLGVRHLRLFGSFARREAGPDSDLDFVVDLDRHTFDRYMDLELFLEDLFDRRVDLVLEPSIKPLLRERILSEAIDAA